MNNYEEPTTTFTEQSTARHGQADDSAARQESYYSQGEEGEEYYDDEEDITITGARERSRRPEQGGEGEDVEDNHDAYADISTDSLLASLHLDQPSKSTKAGAKWADVDSPYQKITKEFSGGRPAASRPSKEKVDEDSFSLGSSLEEPSGFAAHMESPSLHAMSTPRRGGGAGSSRRPPPRQPVMTRNPAVDPPTGYQDPLLHRVLDKNYRIQATPRGKSAPSRYRNLPSATPRRGGGLFSSHIKPHTGTGGAFSEDDDLFSSPPGSPAPPDLQTQILDSPIHRPPRSAHIPPTTTSTTASSRRFQAGDNPRTPSRHHPSRPQPPVPHPVSVKKMGLDGMGFDEDDDDELLLSPGFSPPVTIQFTLPQRTILATPARVASKRLVRDILRTAGADESGSTDTSNAGRQGGDQGGDEDYELDLGDGSSAAQIRGWRRPQSGGGGRGMLFEEASPTIIRGRGMDLGDETF